MPVWDTLLIKSRRHFDGFGRGGFRAALRHVAGDPWQAQEIRKGIFMRFVGTMLLLVGVSTLAMAGSPNVPEVSPASGLAALAMVSGALLVIRGRRKK